MKFLITCYSLRLSGSATYTFALALELKNKGHDVDVFTFIRGVIADKLENKGVNIVDKVEEIIDKKYSCIIAQHNILALLARGAKPDTPMIFVSHGILPFLEQPPSVDANIQRYIAVSEEVRDNLISRTYISRQNVIIVRNFVDTNRFFPKKEILDKPRTLLFLSNRYSLKVYKNIREACSRAGLKLLCIGKSKRVFNVENYINKADIVISLGRGALEAMSCGRAVIVYDYQGGDGMITRENINEIRKNNFSGRRFKRDYTINELVKEIQKYNKSMGEINRSIILENHNGVIAAEKIIDICNQAKTSFSFKSTLIPYKELMWYQTKYTEKIKKIYSSRTWKLGCRAKSFISFFKFFKRL